VSPARRAIVVRERDALQICEKPLSERVDHSLPDARVKPRVQHQHGLMCELCDEPKQQDEGQRLHARVRRHGEEPWPEPHRQRVVSSARSGAEPPVTRASHQSVQLAPCDGH
jgi:hypothetical protein